MPHLFYAAPLLIEWHFPILLALQWWSYTECHHVFLSSVNAMLCMSVIYMIVDDILADDYKDTTVMHLNVDKQF